jgi:hypothetical protein
MPNLLTKILGAGASSTIDSLGNAIDKIDNSETKLQLQLDHKKLLTELEGKALELDAQLLGKASENVQAEIKGESWLQRSWRPVLMLSFGFIILNNYILVPYFKVPACVLDENIWLLIKIGITGYGAERGLRKLGLDLTQVIRKK